ncbi:MAG: molybdopterin converting factor subunit 1 [Cyclobacteriaceae bacterium]|nr:molybdopterin converting factor subunit 1 [Cyclobacteriaceae bacterium]
MTIDILFFGIARDYAGSRSLKFDFPQDTSVKLIRSTMEQKYPALKGLKRYAVAVNNEYAGDDVVVNAGDEIAILPPVSGG